MSSMELEDTIERNGPHAKKPSIQRVTAQATADTTPFIGRLTPALGNTIPPTAATSAFKAAIAERRTSMGEAAVHLRVQRASESVWGAMKSQADIDKTKKTFMGLAVSLWWQGKAPKTWDAQTSAVRTYDYFAETFQYAPLQFTDEQTIIAFTVWSAPRVTVATIKKYVGHLRTRQAEMPNSVPMPSNTDMPFLTQIWDGLERAQKAVKGGNIRLPMTFNLTGKTMQAKRRWLHQQGFSPDRMSIYSPDNPIFSEAVYSCMSVGALRASEAMVKTTSSGTTTEPLRMKHWIVHDDAFDIAAKEIKFSDDGYSTLSLPGRKNDQLGVRSSVVMGKTGHWQCSHVMVNTYLWERAKRGEKLTPESLLFPMDNGKGGVAPLNYTTFTRHLTRNVQLAGFDPAKYKGHSFRIGAATTMALNGVPAYWIEDLGGWARGSKAVHTYTHLNLKPDEERAKMSAFLVGPAERGKKITRPSPF